MFEAVPPRPPKTSSFTQPQGTRELQRKSTRNSRKGREKKKKNPADEINFLSLRQSGQKQKIEIPHHLLAIFPQDSLSNMHSLRRLASSTNTLFFIHLESAFSILQFSNQFLTISSKRKGKTSFKR